MIKVSNITNAKGRPVVNQFEIIDYDNGTTLFQSYDSIIAEVRVNDKYVYLDDYYWDYSRTTLRHLYNFLGQWGFYNLNKKVIQKFIKEGTFKTTNLNGWVMEKGVKKWVNEEVK